MAHLGRPLTVAGLAGLAGLGALVGAGAVLAWVVLRQPPRVASALGGRGPVVFAARPVGRQEGRQEGRQVAITIDDGPTPGLTTALLGALRAHRARATFFLLGSGVEEHPDLARAAVAGGHEIGNHGWSDRPAGLLSRVELADDLNRTATTIEAATGIRARFMRPGSGWLRPGQLRDVRAGGAEVALGSIAVLDLEVRDVERELAFVLRRVRPGSVIVLHEGRPERAAVVPLLDRLLGELGRRGYECVTLSDLVDGAARAAASENGGSPQSVGGAPELDTRRIMIAGEMNLGEGELCGIGRES